MSVWRYILVVLLSLALIVCAFHLFKKPLPELEISRVEPAFHGQSSYDYMEELVTSFPSRDIYHQDGKDAARWLRLQLASLNLPVYTQEFSQYVKDEVVEGQENVFAVSEGTVNPEEIILVVAHYDIPPFVYQGAMDNGSGVGVALELARVFSEEEHDRTMVFLMSDSEEYGAMTGALHFMDEYAHMDQVRAVMVLDMVNPGEMEAMRVFPMGLQSGFTPLWLRELSVRSAGLEAAYEDPGPVTEWIYRTVAVSPTEAGVFLRAGIPAVYLGGVPEDEEIYNRIHHTEHDTIDKIEVSSMNTFGKATERILRSLDELDEFPSGSMFYLKTRDSYIPAPAVFLIQIILILPLGYAILSGYRQRSGIPGLAETFKREFIRWFVLFASGVAGYLVLKLLPYTGLMVRYELYPATQRDPVLYSPQYLPVIITVAAIVLSGFFLRHLFRRHRVAITWDWEGARLFLLSGLALLYMISWIAGAGYIAATFLLFPVLLWPLLGEGRSFWRRGLNLFLVLFGFLIYLIFLYAFSNIFEIGVMWWYLLMASSYGLFSYRAILAVIAGLSLFIMAFTLARHSAVPSDRLDTRFGYGNHRQSFLR